MANARQYSQHYREDMVAHSAEEHTPGINRTLLTRRWDLNIPVWQGSALLAEMDEYTSEKNAKPQRWVDNPGVNPRGKDGAAFTVPGRYRLVSNRIARPGQEKDGIYQVLAQGWLQSPVIPQPTDPNAQPDPDAVAKAWAAIDAEGRIVTLPAYSDADAKKVMGLVNVYTILYANVAQDSASDFAKAIEARPDIVIADGDLTPVFFGRQPLPAGTYRFVKAQAKEQEDGSAEVVAILADMAAPENQALLYVRNWQVHDYRLHWTEVPVLPDGIPPPDVMAEDTDTVPGGGTPPLLTDAGVPNQKTTGVIYAIGSLIYDKEKGLYSLELSRKEAQPYYDKVSFVQGDGTTETYHEFGNVTTPWLQRLADSFKGTNSWMRSQLNEWKLQVGKIMSRTPKESSDGNTVWIDASDRLEIEVREAIVDGMRTAYEYTYYYRTRTGYNIVHGYNALTGGYVGAFGSTIEHDFKTGWYFVRRVHLVILRRYVYNKWDVGGNLTKGSPTETVTIFDSHKIWGND